MSRVKYIGAVLVVVAFFGVIWFHHPAKEEAKQLERQISWQYIHANYLLRDNVDELLKWNFNQSLTDKDKVYLRELSDEFLYITGIIFSGNVAHQEWRNRINDTQGYLNNYVYGPSLSSEEVDDLYQALQATRFISMDLNDYVENYHDFYDAMHDEKHEMVERVEKRLAARY